MLAWLSWEQVGNWIQPILASVLPSPTGSSKYKSHAWLWVLFCLRRIIWKHTFSLCHFISNDDDSNITIYLLCIACQKKILWNCKDLDVCLQHQQLRVLYLLVIQTKRIIFHHLRAELGIRNSWNLVTKAYSFFYYLELAFYFPFSTKDLPLIIPH